MLTETTETIAPILLPRERTELHWHLGVEQQLFERWDAGRMPHALMFTGTKGIGKATLAYRLARHILTSRVAVKEESFSLFADLPATPVDHPGVRRIASNTHADLLVLETGFDAKKGKERREITVDEVRTVKEFLSLTPSESDWRVVLIDSIDDLNRNAANAMLKILEEPPAQAVLLLVSHNPGSILATIRSRCQAIKLSLPDRESFAEIIRLSLPKLETRTLHTLYHFAFGSPGLAINMMESKALTLYKEMVNLLSAPKSLSLLELQQFIDGVSGKEQQKEWQMVQHMFRWLMANCILVASHAVAKEEIVAGERDLVHKLAASKPLTYWLETGEWMNTLFADVDALYLDRKQALTTLFHAFEIK